MNDALQSAYVLHVRSYRETSGLIDFITPEFGRMTLLAKGFKSGKKQRKSFLQPFRKLSIAWVGRGELKTLTTAEEMEAPLVLEEKALMSGLYVNELLTRLLHPHDPHVEIFELYEQTLSALSTSVTLELVLRNYEKNILEALGYGLLLDADVEGEALDPRSFYCYLPESGPVKTDKPVSGGVLLSGQTLLMMNSGKLSGERALKESKLLMRHILSHYIGEKPIKTRELFRYY
jgi:DNA repair protein RecO (recombination protein O)